MNHSALLILAKITIFALMFAIGVNLPLEKLLALWRRPDWLFRTLLAVVVLVPLVVILLLKLFHLPLEVTTGLAFLAAAPGAPMMTKRVQMIGASLHQAAGLQLTLALSAVLVTPLTLQVFNALFTLETERVSVLEVSRQIAMVQLLPVTLGLALQKYDANVALKIGKLLRFMADRLFLVLVVALLIPAFRLTLQIGFMPILVMSLMVIFSLAIGHWVGGSDLERHSALAIACIARNLGLALFLAILNGVERQVLPTLVAYAIVGAIIALPYSKWSKRKLTEFPYETRSL